MPLGLLELEDPLQQKLHLTDVAYAAITEMAFRKKCSGKLNYKFFFRILCRFLFHGLNNFHYFVRLQPYRENVLHNER